MGSSAVTKIGGSGGGSKITINQTNSFSAGDVVRYDASTAVYVKALATTTELAEAIGIVETATTSNFVLVLGGKIDTSQFSVVNEDGTTETKAGDVYFLSATTEGKLTQSAPTTTGTIRKAMLTQTTADGIGYVTNYIGIQNGIGATDLVDISEIQPVGSISPFAGDANSVPNGFLLCDGQAFSAGDFPELATLLGSKYGAIEGDLYRVPDLRGKFALGNNPTGDGGNAAFTRRVEGAEGGAETHVLTVNEMPGHNHDATYRAFLDDAVPGENGGAGDIYQSATEYTNAGSPQIFDVVASSNQTTTMNGELATPVSVLNIGTQGPVISNDWLEHGLQISDLDYILADRPVTVNNRGDNLPHNNLPPFLSVNFIIKASANASAAILTTGIKNLSDVDVSRGATAGSDNVRNGDILVYNTNSQNFVVAPRLENENFIRNGECRLWQRGTTFLEGTDSVLGYTGIPNSKFTADGFFYRNTGGSAFKVIRGSENAIIPLTIATAGMDFIPARRNFVTDGVQNATETLEVQRTYVSAFTPLAPESHTIETFVEGYDFARLIGCDYMTLSFYAYTAATDFNTGGRTIGVSFRNKANSRSYVTSFTPSVGAWQKHEIKVPLADIFTDSDIGNWNFDSTMGLSITFTLSAGTSLRVANGSENSWVNGNFIATQTQFDLTNASNVTNTTSLGLALLKLEAGAYATKFTCLPWVEAVEKSRRYFQKSYDLYQIPGTITTGAGQPGAASFGGTGVVVDDPVISNTCHAGILFPVQMRGTPSVISFNPVNGDANEIRSFHGEQSPTSRTVSRITASSTKIMEIIVSSSLPTDDRRRLEFEYTADAELINPDTLSDVTGT